MESKKLFRCSSYGRLMVGADKLGLTDAQKNELQRLKVKQLSGKELTPIQQGKKKELEAKRDAPPQLSAGAKTYIEEEFYKDYFDYSFRFANKYTRKGNEVEQASIRQVGTFLGYPFATKAAPEFLENGLICTTGYDWKVGKFVFDQKNVWEPKGLKLFEQGKDTSIYEWQLKGYAMLLNELKGESIEHGAIIRTLMNPPENEIRKQARLLWVEAGNNYYDEMDAQFLLDVKAEFDFEAKMPNIADRMRIYKVDMTTTDVNLITTFVTMAQNYYDSLLQKAKQANTTEIEFFKNK